MRSTRSTVVCTLFISSLAGCDVTGSGNPLTINGTVTRAGSATPVANATVRIYSNPFIGEGYLMESVETDAQGRYTARIEEQRTYRKPNCAAMSMQVTADGYAPGTPPSLGTGLSTADDPRCESGTVTVDVTLTPLP